ncbi:MAG: hypothetical protein ACJ71K_02885 [Nitrososphaeraceae archaeon]
MSSNSSSSSTNLALSGAAYNNFVDTIKSDQIREQYKRCLPKECKNKSRKYNHKNAG